MFDEFQIDLIDDFLKDSKNKSFSDLIRLFAELGFKHAVIKESLHIKHCFHNMQLNSRLVVHAPSDFGAKLKSWQQLEIVEIKLKIIRNS